MKGGEDASCCSGALFVVSTPIGNLDDFSPRAVNVLQAVKLILCEDTRKFSILSRRFSIFTQRESFHEHNEQHKIARCLQLLEEGQSIALVSEAGTPTISDPGFRLVRACQECGVAIRSVPGPCAAIAALSISGIEPDRFCFEGFVPQKPRKRRAALAKAVLSDYTTIFYESPHRLLRTLAELAELAPTRNICIAREITKLHEETLTGQAVQIHTSLAERSQIRGEIVLLIARKDS